MAQSVQNFATGPIASASATQSWTQTIGSGTKRKCIVAHMREGARTYSSVTFNGNAMNSVVQRTHSVATTLAVQMWEYDIPDALDAGDYTVSVTLSSGLSDSQGYSWQTVNSATGTPEDSDSAEVLSAASAVISTSLTNTAGALVLAAVINSSGSPTWSWSNATSERAEGNETNLTTGIGDGVVVSGGTATATATASTNTGAFVLCAMSIAEVAVTGPTINTQPSAATVRVNGDTTNTATFTVAATTSGGSLTYDWELETTVGGGVYANLADGSGATWTGQAAASAVGTFSAKTLSGRRVRCNVTDSNGTTTTDAVTLTVLDGPVLSAATASTNGSGVASVTMTSDDALSANGEILLVTASIGGTVIARTTVRPA